MMMKCFAVCYLTLSLLLALFAFVVGSDLVVERVLVNGSSTVSVGGCPFSPSAENAQPAFGLYRSPGELCPLSPFDTQLGCQDAVSIGSEALELAQQLGSNGTAVAANGGSVVFHGIGGTAADLTTSMATFKEGWSVVMMVKVNQSSNGVLMALFDDTRLQNSVAVVEQCLSGANNCTAGESLALYVAIAVVGTISQVNVISPPALAKNGGVVSFILPSLFDGLWHLVGVVFEPLAAGHYVRVSLHVDGVDPFEAGLEYCGKAGVGAQRLSSVATPRWNTTAGALSVGGAIGSYHALLLYPSALSRQAIAALGTSAIRAVASGGNRLALFAVGFTFIAVAVAFACWSVAHAIFEVREVEECSAPQHEEEKDTSVPSAEVTPHANGEVASQATKTANIGNKNAGSTKPEAAAIAAKAASVGLPHIGQMANTTASAVSSIRSAAVPVAAASSAVMVASVTSIALEVPQQMSVLFSHMTFPAVFRDVFGNFFDMVTIRFDFPEVAVPPYAPLIVVLIGLMGASMAAVWQGQKDRRQFDACVRNWKGRVRAYRILLRYVVDGLLSESNNISLTASDVEKASGDVVTNLVAAFPTPAGRFTMAEFDAMLSRSITNPDQRSELSKALHYRCEHLLDMMPPDSITTLCMCLIPQVANKVMSHAEVATTAAKLQALSRSFDRTLEMKINESFLPSSQCDGNDCVGLVRQVAMAWARAPQSAKFDDILQSVQEQRALRHCSRSQPQREQPHHDEASLEIARGDPPPDACQSDKPQPEVEMNVNDASPVIGEDVFLRHVNTFVRAVVTWVMEPNDAHVKAFAGPFLEYYRTCETDGATTTTASTHQEIFLSSPNCTIESCEGHLQSSRDAAMLYSVLCEDDEVLNTSGKVPPYNRHTPVRSYTDSLASPLAPIAPHELRLRILGEKAANDTKGAQQDILHHVLPTTSSCCCPQHSTTTVVKASAAYLASQTLDGRQMYRCCNAGWDEIKQVLHGKAHSAGDECDDGEVFMCPESTCSFAICGRCLRREVKKMELLRVHGATVVHTLRHLNPPLTSTLSVVVLEALLFPVTQIPLLVLTCSPSVSCWLGGCYATWSAEFVVSFCLGVLLLVLRVAVGVWLHLELRRRQVVCEGALIPDDGVALSVRNMRWEYFVQQCDRSLLRSMYVSSELSYIAWSPLVKLTFDVGLVLAVCLTPADTVAQKCVVGVIYAVRGIMLSVTNPNLMLPLDILTKAVVIHQLVVLGLSTAALGQIVGEQHSNSGSSSNTPIVTLMIIVTFSFLCFVVAVIMKVIVVPFKTALWIESMSALVRRDAQAALLPHDAASLERKHAMLVETLQQKRFLCATLWDIVRARVKVLHSLPFPTRGGSQLAVTAAMILQTDHERQKSTPASEDAKPDAHVSREKALQNAEVIAMQWLENVTSCGAFHDSDESTFSLSTRQLLGYESDALGAFLARLPHVGNSNILDVGSGGGVENRCLQAMRTVLPEIEVGDERINSPVPGPMTHCNQLQLLSAATLANDLDFSNCNLRGCRLNKGTHVRCCNMRGSDLSVAVLPECSFVACDMTHARFHIRSFGTFASMLAVIGHAECVDAVAFSPDGILIASGSSDNTLRLWDAASGQELHSFQGYSSSFTSIAFSPDGTLLVSGSNSSSLYLFDLARRCELIVLSGHISRISCVAFSPNGSRIASGSFDRSIRVWSSSDGTQLFVLSGHSRYVTSIAFSPDGQQLVSGSHDHSIRLWDVNNGCEVRAMTEHTSIVSTVAFCGDGRRVVSGGHDNTVRIWDATSGAQLRILQGHQSSVTAVACSPDGSRVASGGNDKTVRLWDAASGAELRVFTGHLESVGCVAFSPDGARVVSGSDDGGMCVWNAASAPELRIATGHTMSVSSVALALDGARIVSGSHDKTLRIWDVRSGAQLRVISGHTGAVNSVAFAPEGQRVVSGSDDTTVRVWDVADGRELCSFVGHLDVVKCVTFSPDGAKCASGGEDNTVRIWDPSSGMELFTISGHSSCVRSVVFTRDGDRLATGGDDRIICVWDAINGAKILSLNGHTEGVRSVAFSPDGTRIASASEDLTVRLWDATTGVEVFATTGHTSYVNSVVFAPDGTRIASGSTDNTVRLWDATNGSELHVLNNHSSDVTTVAFSPCGKFIVSGSQDTTVRMFTLDDADGRHGVATSYICEGGELKAIPFQLLCLGSAEGQQTPLQGVVI